MHDVILSGHDAHSSVMMIDDDDDAFCGVFFLSFQWAEEGASTWQAELCASFLWGGYQIN
jgi:hypothetical protein